VCFLRKVFETDGNKQQPIPFGHGNQKGNCNSRFPAGLTTRKANEEAAGVPVD
jgi:hypothetical protein